jgi:hypothetical protein
MKVTKGREFVLKDITLDQISDMHLWKDTWVPGTIVCFDALYHGSQGLDANRAYFRWPNGDVFWIFWEYVRPNKKCLKQIANTM